MSTRTVWGRADLQRTAGRPIYLLRGSSRPPSGRQLHDEDLKVDIVRVHKENFNVYGAWTLWRQLNRAGIPVGRDHVARLMNELGLVGVVRGKQWKTMAVGSRTGGMD